MSLSIVAVTIWSDWAYFIVCSLLTAGLVFWAVVVVRDKNTANVNQQQPQPEGTLSSTSMHSTDLSYGVDMASADINTKNSQQHHPHHPVLLAALVGTGGHLAIIFSGMALACFLQKDAMMYPEYPDADTLAAVSQRVFNVYANTSFFGGGIAMLTCYTMLQRRQGGVTTAQRVMTTALTATLFPLMLIATGFVLGCLSNTDTPNLKPPLSSSAALHVVLQQWLCVSTPLSFAGALIFEKIYLCTSRNEDGCHKHPNADYSTASLSRPVYSPGRSALNTRNVVAAMGIALSPFVVVLPHLPQLLLLHPANYQNVNVANSGEPNPLGLVHVALFYISIAAASIVLSGVIQTGRWWQWLSGTPPAILMYTCVLMSYFRNPPTSSNSPFAATYFCVYVAVMCVSVGLAGGAVSFWTSVWVARATTQRQ